MSMNMELFSPAGQEVIYKAHKIVREYKQEKLEPEHLLAAVLERGDDVIVAFFERFNMTGPTITETKALVYGVIPRLTTKVSMVDHVYLSRVSEILIRKAALEAEGFDGKKIGPEHLLMATLDVPGRQISLFLKNKGFTKEGIAEKAREFTPKISAGNIPESEEPSANPIEEYCVDLIEMARANKFDPVIGRDGEVRRVIQVLSRRTKNNPVLIGEPGVGKTAIIEGLAQRILAGDVPETLKDKRLLSLDLGGLVAGAKYRGDFEDRVKLLLKEIEKTEHNAILFIDELHTLVGAGAVEGALDASNMLKPALARGELHCVGASTVAEYKKYIEKDQALARRFQKIDVKEPGVEDCIGIMRGLKEKYEVHHGVRIKDAAIISAVELAKRYITDRFLPDKAIDLVDEAASKIRIEIDSMPTEIDVLNRKIIQLEIEKAALSKETDAESKKRLDQVDVELESARKRNGELKRRWENERESIQRIRQLKEEIETTRQKELEAQREGNLELAARLKYGELDGLERELEGLNREMDAKETTRFLKEEVDEDDVAGVVEKWTGIPIAKMLGSEKKKLLKMELLLGDRIVGQSEAISAVAHSIRRARTGIQDPNRPLGSFVFLGSTGVGKTELVKALADFLFNDEKAVIRLDMSEYMEKHAISRLVGPPPGYVGFEEGGSLTEAVRRRPYSVVLFDEIEKGHGEIFNILLQVLDEGVLTDSKGVAVDFKNAIVILTTNLGNEYVLESFQRNDGVQSEKIRSILLTRFRPELLNRLDEIVIFHPLGVEDIRQIVGIQVARLEARLQRKNIFLKVDKEAEFYLAKKGYDREFGARPLKRVLQRELQDVVSYKMLDGTINPGDTVEVRAKDNRLTLHRLR